MNTNGMITSKEIIDIANISRATLNNYIKSGLLPRPVVGPPPPGDRSVKQIGYFPEDVLSRLDRIKQLKGEGRAMEEIVALLATPTASGSAPLPGSSSSTERVGAAMARQTSGQSRISDRPLRVTICDIDYPAYLINRKFEVEWVNRQAEEVVFGKKVRGLVDIESRNIFRLFFGRREQIHAEDWAELTRLHLAVLYKEISDPVLASLYRGITLQESAQLIDLFHSLRGSGQQGICHLPLALVSADGTPCNFWVHTMTFREGTFFVYLPQADPGQEVQELLSRRGQVINDLLRRRMPSLVSLCVLVAGLQDSVRISAELLPAQYFDLINGLWESVAPTLEAHKAIYGKHVGDGMLYYFLDKPGENYIINCINCAIELHEVIKKYSTKWRGIKGWDNELCFNTGINEGQEFFGTIHSANFVEFTALGDTINIAARLSEFANNGAIWATKNLISKLSQEEQGRYCFGVPSKMRPGNGFIRDSFARLGDLLSENSLNFRQLSAIGGLPVTEIKNLVHQESAHPGAPAFHSTGA